MSQIPIEAIRTWLFQKALPFWAAHGVDHEHGGFLEELNPDGTPSAAPLKRVRVTPRQIYVFSHAALLGWREGEALSQRGYEYLIEKAWLGPDRGWAKMLTRAGEVSDATPDLYDIAFCLYGLAWRYKLTRDAEALRYMHATVDFVTTKMAAPNGGYWHQLPPKGPRLQNPHMHWLEASIAAFEATQDQRFLDQAGVSADLFEKHFFDGRTLGEYFTEDWKRVEGDEGRRLEPGHQFEWAWIVSRYQALTGKDFGVAARALVATGEGLGVDPVSLAAFDEVRDDGAPLRNSSRTWPNTERLKGHLALFERDPAHDLAPAAQSAQLLLNRYLTPEGAWVDNFDASSKPMVTAIPASTFYHVFLAFSEVMRLEAKLSAR